MAEDKPITTNQVVKFLVSKIEEDPAVARMTLEKFIIHLNNAEKREGFKKYPGYSEILEEENPIPADIRENMADYQEAIFGSDDDYEFKEESTEEIEEENQRIIPTYIDESENQDDLRDDYLKAIESEDQEG